jgi:hypothetical protein
MAPRVSELPVSKISNTLLPVVGKQNLFGRGDKAGFGEHGAVEDFSGVLVRRCHNDKAGRKNEAV